MANPNHDDKGRFSEGPSGGGAPAVTQLDEGAMRRRQQKRKLELRLDRIVKHKGMSAVRPGPPTPAERDRAMRAMKLRTRIRLSRGDWDE